MKRERSWLYEIESQKAIKEIDKSSFLVGSHIPKLVRPIFECEDIIYGEKKYIVLEYLGNEYSAYIEQDKNGKIRIIWRELLPLLKEKFIEEYDSLVKKDCSIESTPKLEFIKINGCRFNIDLYDKEIKKLNKFFEKLGIDDKLNEEELIGEIRKYIINGRINHDKYKEKLLKKDGKCRMCGLDDKRFLIASHSKSWVESSDKEKVDVNNGFLLCPNHDALYDKYLITFEDDGKIRISDTIKKDDYKKLGIEENMIINISVEELVYIKWHRKKFFEKEKETNLKLKEIDRYQINLV